MHPRSAIRKSSARLEPLESAAGTASLESTAGAVLLFDVDGVIDDLLRAPAFLQATSVSGFLTSCAGWSSRHELTDRVIREAIDEDVSEASDAEPPKALTEGATDRPGSDGGSENAGNDERSPT